MKRRLLPLLTILPLLFLGTFSQITPAHADANTRIIDDAVFDNVNSMSAGDIQSWFSGNFPNGCLTHYQAPDPQSWSGYGANVSAAQAIADTAHIWGINPQVILTTLEKEEGLVSGHGAYGCSQTAFNSAMGYDCPGPIQPATGTCVAHQSNLGFSAQINHGSWQLEFGRFRSEGNGNLGWDGDGDITYYGYMTQGTRARCNSCTPQFYSGNITLADNTTLNVENGATASLYSYTPYIQSFGRIFTGWFGSPYAAQNVTNATWSFEKLDGAADAVSGRTGTTGQTPTPITLGTTLHVFYYDRGQGVLRHSYADNNGWHFEVLDGAGGSGGRISANVGVQVKPVIYNGVIHLFYYDLADGTLRHAWSDTNGANWTFETLDGGSGTTPGGYHDNLGLNVTPVVYGSTLQLFYYDATRGVLRHSWYNGSTWRFENLDGDVGSIGQRAANVGQGSTAATYGTSLQLFYYDATNGNLRHGFTGGSVPWRFENLDGDVGSIGHIGHNVGLMSTATDYNNVLYLFYYDSSSGGLRAAYADSGGWHFATLDGTFYAVSGFTDNLGMDPGAIPYNGTMQLFYYDATNSTLRHALATLP